ncbi:MAG: ABC transporter ATP-binding protein [Proteobacteria bacterium]|jgi:lipoprotein-releasing system ATP-binding protein|nr:ABC transporter ATP-binding protein [Pseudomonadota bacterium]
MSGVRVQTSGLIKVYRKAGHVIRVLDGIDIELDAGERVAVVGDSGAGKSTLLHLLGLLDQPSEGTISLDGRLASSMTRHQQAHLRNRMVGFVFQAHNLLPEHTALGNVMVPVRLSGASVSVAKQRAQALLRAVGLGDRMLHQPGELSGGEQQRVALARALVMGPGLVLADEPTGNLDPRTASGVFELMLRLNEQLGSTLVVVTHSGELASRFPRCLRLTNGRFEEE